MKKERIIDMIDNKIVLAFTEGLAISVIKKDLSEKEEKFTKLVQTNSNNSDMTLKEILSSDWESADKVKTKYSIFYVQHVNKRIKDLNWLELNKYKFRKYSNSQVFNLIKLKEKLSLDNSLS
jgi:hypothetical protein